MFQKGKKKSIKQKKHWNHHGGLTYIYACIIYTGAKGDDTTIDTLPKTDIAPEHRSSQKETSSSNIF